MPENVLADTRQARMIALMECFIELMKKSHSRECGSAREQLQETGWITEDASTSVLFDSINHNISRSLGLNVAGYVLSA